jgi:RNA polymerase sigma factor (sigma-70 family)
MAQANQKTTIAEFIVAEHNRLVAFVRSRIEDGADRDGEDIVQDVALSLLDRADVLMPIEALSAYVYQSLRNRVVDQLRRRKRMVSLDEPVEEQEGPSLLDHLSEKGRDVENEAARLELKRRLVSAMESLPDEQKAIVIETELKGRSFRELAGEWGIPLGTLLARKSRAMARIRASLEDFRP